MAITITDAITAPIIFPPFLLLFPPHINPMRGTTGYVNQFRIHPLVQVLPRLVFQESGKVPVFGAGDVIVGLQVRLEHSQAFFFRIGGRTLLYFLFRWGTKHTSIALFRELLRYGHLRLVETDGLGMHFALVVHLRIGFQRNGKRSDIAYLHPAAFGKELRCPMFYLVHHGKDIPFGQPGMGGYLLG